MASEDERVRIVLWAIMVVSARALSSLMISEFLRIYHSSDAQLRAHFEGQAFEDIFGFGFWFTWCLLAAIEALFLFVAWMLVKTELFRISAAILLAIFLVSSILYYAQDTREVSLYVSSGRS